MQDEEKNEAASPGEQTPGTDGVAVSSEPPRNPNMKWYIIHSYSGFERKVKESLESRVAAFGLQEKIGKVLIPTESVTEVRGGKKYTSERMFYPGYVLVEMDMDDHVWHVVKSTPRVTGLVGTGQQPTPLSDAEVQHIVYKVADSRKKPKLKVMEFCKQFNARTNQKEMEGLIIPVVVSVYNDRTFTFITKTPPASILLKRAAGIAKGSGTPNKDKVGKVTLKQVEDIAKQKMPDLNAASVDSAIRSIRGTARSMGIEVVG